MAGGDLVLGGHVLLPGDRCDARAGARHPVQGGAAEEAAVAPGLPGAGLAMVVFLLASIGLRLYISWITTTGYTYGALATPIAFLLFTFFIGLAIVIGAYFNAAIQELWPARMTRRQRRRWRRLEMDRASRASDRSEERRVGKE